MSMPEQDVELPDDLTEFLRSGKQLEYDIGQTECGRVTLLPVGEHVLGEVWVDSENHPYAYTDPHFGEKGYYPIPAVGLVATCEYFDPCLFILLWLPDWGLYGTWDDDHWELRAFPNVGWTQIAGNPLPYINVMWYPGKVENELFVPWLSHPHRYPFKSGWPF